MPVNTPIIDSRNQVELVKQVRKLAIKYLENFPDAWKDISSIESDKRADALIHIFARMMEITISRLNKSLDKNFLTFLYLIGVRQFPPRTARVPLTFNMVQGTNQYGLIPAGTQVATAEVKGKETVVFETEKTLTVIVPRLVKAVSLSITDNNWTDHSPILFDKNKEGHEELFRGKNLISPHRLYIGYSKLFSFKEETDITLEIEIISNSINSSEPNKWKVEWYYSDESSIPKPLKIKKAISTDSSNKSIIDGDVANLLKSGHITFEPVSRISEISLTGIEKEKGLKNTWISKWIFAELITNVLSESLPQISSIKANLTNKTGLTSKENPTGDKSVIPDVAFFNNDLLDLSKDFYPFGERPKFNDTFYIGSKEVFSKTGEDITMEVTLSKGVDAPLSKNIKLSWEFWNGIEWEKLGETITSTVSNSSYNFNDQTKAFTLKDDKKIVTFKCPNIEEKEINGEKNRWIRVRIIEGNYGDDARYEKPTTFEGIGTITCKKDSQTITGENTKFQKQIRIGDILIHKDKDRQIGIVTEIVSDTSLTVSYCFEDCAKKSFSIEMIGWTYIPPTYKPPSISKLTLQYHNSQDPGSQDTGPQEYPEIILAYNNFIYQKYKCSETFIPFQPVEDKKSALYLAFDQNIASLPVTIFFSLIGKAICRNASASKEEESSLQENSHKDPFLIWQYWTGKEWSELRVEDNTINLTKRELIQFLAPSDIAKRSCFGFEPEYYWIKAELEKGKYESFPMLRSIHTNTVWARNQVTVQNEILGSSNGKPGQVFKFSRSSVLPGQRVLVMELSLTQEEKLNIINEEQGNDAIEEIKDNSDNVVGYWVRWHEVVHFYSSEANSRHYIIDRDKGTITFGDGERGMIPPAERNNIKCSYKAGGGSAGNVKAGTITKLRTTFPYVDSVTNPEDADGGSDKENMDKLRERGPQTLKHRDRAVTYEDFVWLVKEASPKIVRVKCLPTTYISLKNQPGFVTIIIVPESDDQKPVPSQQLISEIESYISERTSTYLTSYASHSSQINLIGPGYLKVWVEASVKFISISEAKIIEGRIIDTLNKFFHPLYGGPEKKGWDFGRSIYISEVYEAIENTEGVDYVEDLKLNASAQIYKLIVEGINLPDSYPKKSIILIGDKIRLSLAKSLPKETDIKVINLTGFKEGDSVILRSEYNVNLTVKSISHKSLNGLTYDELECKPEWRIEYPFPKEKSTVESSDKAIKSCILKDVLAQRDNSLTSIQIHDAAGLKEGDLVILRREYSVNLIVKSVSHKSLNDFTYDELECEPEWRIECPFPKEKSILETTDRSIKSFTLNNIPAQKDITLTPIQIAIPEVDDNIVLIHAEKSWENASGKITCVDNNVDTVFVDDNYLIYSGSHMINKK